MRMVVWDFNSLNECMSLLSRTPYLFVILVPREQFLTKWMQS